MPLGDLDAVEQFGTAAATWLKDGESVLYICADPAGNKDHCKHRSTEDRVIDSIADDPGNIAQCVHCLKEGRLDRSRRI
jgi:hypothetical protein